MEEDILSEDDNSPMQDMNWPLFMCLPANDYEEKYFKLELAIVDEDGEPTISLFVEKTSVYIFGVECKVNEVYELKESDATKPRKFLNKFPLVGSLSYSPCNRSTKFVPAEMVSGVRYISKGGFKSFARVEELQRFMITYIIGFSEGARLGPVASFVIECLATGLPQQKSDLIVYLLNHWSQLSLAVLKALFSVVDDDKSNDESLKKMIKNYEEMYGEDAALVFRKFHVSSQIIRLFAVGFVG